MNRRGFLGSVIGFVAGQDFLAKLITEPPQRVILPYKMAFHDQSRELILQAPGVKDVQLMDSGHKLLFIAEDLKPIVTTCVNACSIYTNDGQLIQTSKIIGGPVWLCNGDTLKCQVELSVHNKQYKSDSEMVKAILQARKEGKLVRC